MCTDKQEILVKNGTYIYQDDSKFFKTVLILILLKLLDLPGDNHCESCAFAGGTFNIKTAAD